MTSHDAELPQVVRALWGTLEAGRRGPRPAMSIRSIAAVAVEIADADGLGAVSMAAVARRLGFTTMSLYRYLDSKDDLELVMVEEALGPPPGLNRRRGWRGQLEQWARAEAARLVAHPWALEIRPSTPPLGPNTLGWMDLGLQALGSTGLDSQRTASSLLIVDGYVRNHVQVAQQYADAATTRRWADQLRSLIDPDRLPALAAGLDAGAFDDEPAQAGAFADEEFEFGLQLVLDGIEALARSVR